MQLAAQARNLVEQFRATIDNLDYYRNLKEQSRVTIDKGTKAMYQNTTRNTTRNKIRSTINGAGVQQS